MERIGIPRGTQFVALFRNKEARAWDIWTAVRDRNAPYSQWAGTYLRCRDDGSVTRVTTGIEEWDDLLQVKPRD